MPDVDAIAGQIGDWRDADCFICGPRPFMDGWMDGTRQALIGLQVAEQRIHLERFAAQPDSHRVAATPPDASRLWVSLNGRRHALDLRRGEVLLDAMGQIGLQPPNACRIGVCAACKCRVVSGSVTMRNNQTLSEPQVRQGWALACQAEPDSAELQVEY